MFCSYGSSIGYDNDQPTVGAAATLNTQYAAAVNINVANEYQELERGSFAQPRIDSYFMSYHDNKRVAAIKSKRLRTAVQDLAGAPSEVRQVCGLLHPFKPTDIVCGLVYHWEISMYHSRAYCVLMSRRDITR